MNFLKLYSRFLLFFTLFILLLSLFIRNINYNQSQQFDTLSRSFISGKLYLSLNTNSHGLIPYDSAPYNDKYYWPLGPFPAIILIPVIIIENIFHISAQGLVNLISIIIIFLSIAYITKKNNYTNSDALLLSITFIFGSVFYGIAVAPNSWCLGQSIATLLLFLAIAEHYRKNNPFIIGTLIALSLLTRITTAPVFLFFILYELNNFFPNKDIKKLIKRIVQYVIPIFISILILGIYNYLRFDNPLEQGYKYQFLYSNSLRKATEYGLISIKHIPGNLYYAFISTPLPVFRDGISHVLKFPFIKINPWGTSIFITSPYLIYLFFFKYKEKESIFLLITSFIISIPIFLYYGIGWVQIGYRYSLDFLPLLYTIFIAEYKYIDNNKLSPRIKILLVLSCVIMLFLELTTHYAH